MVGRSFAETRMKFYRMKKASIESTGCHATLFSCSVFLQFPVSVT